MQKELQNMRIQYVEKERADKSNRIELKEMQIKVLLSHLVTFCLTTEILRRIGSEIQTWWD